MKLTMAGIKDREAWEKAGIQLPGYDVEEVSEKGEKSTALGTFRNRQYFPCLYRRNCRWSSGRRCSGQGTYLCGDL